MALAHEFGPFEVVDLGENEVFWQPAGRHEANARAPMHGVSRAVPAVSDPAMKVRRFVHDRSGLPLAVQRPESIRFAETVAPSGWYIRAND